ncbi:hypothetical protein F2Q70_00035938 [Brassica cretica]|uniref:Uncharacterized protein n=1 Tax=Brassica cretica TaxID=69181 RepID=A0A8S9JYW9_BRACR|nr:hypothetical protein F2Q70_00035938 [Brassica cretica]
MHLRSDSSSGHPFVFDLQKKSFTDNSDELFVWIFRCRSPGSSHLGLEVLLILVLGLQYLYLNFLVTCITRFDYCLWKSLLNPIEKIMELKNLKKAGPQKPMFTVEWIDNALRGLRYQTGRHRLTCWPSLIEGMVNLVDMSIRAKIRV